MPIQAGLVMPYFRLSSAYSGWCDRVSPIQASFESVVPIQAGLMMPYYRLSSAYSG